MAPATYRYELRLGDEIVATGHLTNDEPLAVGQSLKIGNRQGIVRLIEPVLRGSELRLVVRLREEGSRS